MCFCFQERSLNATQILRQAKFANPGLGLVTPETLNAICHYLKSVMRHSRMPKICLTPKESNPKSALGSCLKSPSGQWRWGCSCMPWFGFLGSVPALWSSQALNILHLPEITGSGIEFGWRLQLCSFYLDLQNRSLIHPARKWHNTVC